MAPSYHVEFLDSLTKTWKTSSRCSCLVTANTILAERRWLPTLQLRIQAHRRTE